MVIKNFNLKGLTTKEIKGELDKFYGTSSLLFANDKNWLNELKHSRTSTHNKHRSGLPVKKIPFDMIDKILDIVLSDWRIK